MDKHSKTLFNLVVIIFIFSFGWVSNSTYREIEAPAKKVSLLENIKNRKTLNVVLLNSLSTYYIGTKSQQGFEYDLLKNYADDLGVELNITTAHTVEEALSYIDTINPDIVSAGIAKTLKKEKKYNFGPSYTEVQEQVICNRNMRRKNTFPRDIEDLESLKISVGKGTSYSETLKALQKDGFDINVTVSSELSAEDLLAEVASHKIDCTVVNSNIYSANIRYFPEAALAFSISGREQLGWILAPNSKELKASMYTWLNNFNQSGEMGELKDHYFSYILFYNYYDTKMFYKRIKSRLPKFLNYFKDAGKNYEIPWQLLAAISYQESHWNPNAKSFTGVRGLMMLTRNTAKILKVKNRIDPKESIVGGTKHIKQMIKSVPKRVTGENRLKFALAAYNIGLGHIYDAQSLARKLNLDDASWSDLKKILPLLAHKEYYQYLKYGYARGSEPIKYVESIYNYRNILQTLEDDLKGKKQNEKK